jgi:tight adherence protein B
MRLVAAILAVLVLPAAASAAVIVRPPDLTAYPRVEIVAVTPTPQASAPAVRENGRRVFGLEATNLGRGKSIVLAIDRSRSMRDGALERAVEAARRFISLKHRADRVAIVGFGSTPLELTGFSSATIDADLALRSLTLDRARGTALYDAVRLSARLLQAQPTGGRVLIVLTDGVDVSSTATLEVAEEAARQAGVTVYPIGIEGPQFDAEPLEALASGTGGTYRGASSAGALTAVYEAIAAELRRTWRLAYVTAARPGERVTLAVGDATTTALVPGRRSSTGPYEPAVPAAALEAPGSSVALGLLVGLLLVTAIILMQRAQREGWVKRRVGAHVEGAQRKNADRGKGRPFASSTILRATEGVLGGLRVWQKTARLLERADVPLRTVEFLYLAAGCAFAAGLVAALFRAPSVVILPAMVAGAAIPFGYLKFRAARRRKAFDDQLPDLLLTIAASLKAGHSFKHGLQAVVEEAQPPASKEFQRVLAEARLGRPLEDALADMSGRISSKNLDFVITCVTIQGQVGGSLATLFDMVAEAVRQRQQFARKIRGLTAMGRASAYVLVALPFVLAGAITLLSRDYMEPLFTTGIGRTMIFTGLTMMVIGSFFLRKIVSFRG